MLDFLDTFPIFVSPIFNKLLFIMGFIYVTILVYKFVGFIMDLFTGSEYNLNEQYGQGSWAFVTGASDGIGKQFCLSLAKRGFNIVLVARNKTKLDDVEQEIRKVSNVNTRVVIADFNFSTKETFFSDIMDIVKDIDISLLVNNVGINETKAYHKMTDKNVQDLIIVNCIPQAILMKKFVQLFQNREKKSGIINLSSYSQELPLPYLQLYGASKCFNHYLSEAVSIEYPEIDILSMKPNFVDTRMLNGYKGATVVGVEDFVNNSLARLGKDRSSIGSWKHQLYASLIRSLPDWYREKKAIQGLKRAAESYERKEKKNSKAKKED